MREKKHKVYHMGLVTRQAVEKSLTGVSNDEFKQHYPVPPKVPCHQFGSKVKMYHNSIYLAGKHV